MDYFGEKLRVLFVSSEGWGWRTYISNLKQGLVEQDQLDCVFVTPRKNSYTAVAKSVIPSAVRPTVHRLSVLRGFQRQIKQYKPDIVHASGHLMGYLPCLFSKKIPYSVTIDGSYCQSRMGDSKKSKGGIDALASLERKILSGASCIFSMNSWCSSSLVNDYQISESKIIHHPPLVYGVSDECFRSHFEQRIGKPNVDILFVGNDTKRKGLQDLIEVHQQALSAECTLHIVSTDQVDAGGLQNVKNHGFVNNETLVHKLMPSMDIMVLPTHFDQSPHSLIEGLSGGLPLVATGVGGIEDIVENGYNGFTVNTANDISSPLKNLVRDSALRSRFGQNSREKYLQDFNPSATASGFVNAMVTASNTH